MIDPMFKFTVTIYHKMQQIIDNRNVISWKKAVLTDCFFSAVKAESISGSTIGMADSYTVRTPPKLPFCPAVGDIVVKGNAAESMSDVSGCRPADILQKYRGNAFTARSISDNTAFDYAPHWRISGA